MPPAQPAIEPRLERVIKDAVHPNRRAIDVITGEGMKLSDIFEGRRSPSTGPSRCSRRSTRTRSPAFAAHRNPFIARLLSPE
ncbi:MAG TPA: hypothetical protein VL625_10960 [Patescibacteria group bacterium]|nr:hypothetical protein [Patescibacteria group bacterium]